MALRGTTLTTGALLCAFVSSAQFYTFPGDYAFSNLTERRICARDSGGRQVLQPYIPAFDAKHAFVADTFTVFKYIKNDPAIDLIFKKHLVELKSREDRLTLRVDPLLNLHAGRDEADTAGTLLYTNSRGFIASGSIGEDFYFETLFSENQSVLPGYQSAYAKVNDVIPGQGRWKTFKSNGYDYAFASGFGAIKLGSHFNLQFGHGKHKVGNGYRSLLWSDNAFNYPFIRLSQQWFNGKLRYTNVYATLMNLQAASAIVNPLTERLFQKKPAAFQNLELQVHPRLSMAFFQSLVWKPGDTRNGHRPGGMYFNPLIFTQLAVAGLDNEECNLATGVNIIWDVFKKAQLFAQGIIDRTGLKGMAGGGWQGGFRWFDAFGIKQLTVHGEVNDVGRSLYSTTGAATFTHYNQGVAYIPYSCTEAIATADFRKHRWILSGRAHRQFIKNASGNEIQIVAISAGYLVNPAYNLNVSFGCLSRTGKISTFGASNPNTTYLFFAVRTSVYNLYFDF